MKLLCKTLGWTMIVVLAFGSRAAAKQGYGTLTGVVLDSSGTPQMGATVFLISEDLRGKTVAQLLSNQSGTFSTDRVKPGKYAVRVSLAGYLPAVEQHVAVIADLTTMLRVHVNSVFASLDTLRRKPDVSAEPDDWKWVLRSTAAQRAILQWRDSDVYTSAIPADRPRAGRPHGIIQVTNGSPRFGSPSSLPYAPATAVSYDQRLGNLGRVLLAGQMSYQLGYQRGASGAFASIWLPSGTSERGPETIFVLHQSKFGEAGLMFQEMRLDHTEQFALGDRLYVRAGAEYLRAGIESSVTALRPHIELDAVVTPGWTTSLVIASDPLQTPWGEGQALGSAITELDSLPTVLFHGGKPVLEGSWHEEFSVRHKMTDHARLEAAVFHDSSKHQAIFGSAPAANPNFVQDVLSNAYLYDGGATSSWGARVAFRQKFYRAMEFTAVYDLAGALSPTAELNPVSTAFLNNTATRTHHGISGRISGKLPGAGTQLSASYKWVSGTALSRVDAFGEAQTQIDPNLHFSIRQPLPGLNGRWEALADFSNLLAQGYVSASGADSRIVLVTVPRAFRGGVSFQF